MMLGFVGGVGFTLLVWSYVWERFWEPRLEGLTKLATDRGMENDRLRQRNVDATSEGLEFETKLEATRTELADARSELQTARVQLSEVTKRAEVAEGIVRGQAKHIDALQGSNDTMLAAITDMRRVGFSLPSDVLKEPDPDTITSVDDDDIQAVKTYPHLAAADEL